MEAHPRSVLEDSSRPGGYGGNLSAARLIELSLKRGESRLTSAGALLIETAPYTGRLPQDKFIVRDAASESRIGWGPVNRPFESARFDELLNRVTDYLASKEIFSQDCAAGADPEFRVPIRVLTESPAAALFAQTLFLSPRAGEQPAFRLIHAPGFKADPARDATRSEAFILLNFERRMILIGGTAYAGEIKKSVFTLMNYLLPLQGVLPMHCSANFGSSPGDSAIFFGLSGTGKTTLSAVPERTLVGDDEHGWSGRGIFNFEGGCYAKVIRLSQEGEPEIYEAVHRFGTMLENVVMDPVTRDIRLEDASISENTRASYPIDFIPNMTLSGQCGHPRNILMLTCDAFGVLPPAALLTPDQAMFHFLSGYTAKVAGTEAGVKEPQATFSACFGEPFMPMAPSVYAELLGEKIRRHEARVWLVNTGWSAGPFGQGQRMPIRLTRAVVRAILDGSLAERPMRPHPVFGFRVPVSCPGCPDAMLDPLQAWPDALAYARQARRLAGMFRENFEKVGGLFLPLLETAGPRLI